MGSCLPVFDAAVGDLLRLRCKTEVRRSGGEKMKRFDGFVVCMELHEILPTGRRGLSISNNDDREHLDPLVKRINNDKGFTAASFTNNGNAGTLVGTRGGPRKKDNHYRIDSQYSSTVFANIQYQVGEESKAQCIIRYNPVPAADNPIPREYQGKQIDYKFSDDLVKTMVKDGLDFGAFSDSGRATEIRWRIINVNLGKVEKDVVKSKMKDAILKEYGEDILTTRQFEVIRPISRDKNQNQNDRTRIKITPPL